MTGISFHKPVLVGRKRERQALRALLERASAGDGTLVLLSGEAGIGKTTLVDDLVDRARDIGTLVLAGGCYDLTTTPPYGPWTEALRGYQPSDGLPKLPSWFGNPDDFERLDSQSAIFEEARAFFVEIAEEQPLAVVLEDLHWSDPASLDALRYLGRAFGDTAILLIVTYRDDELTRRHDLYQMLPLLVRESQAQRIHLSRLDRGDVRDLVERRYDLEATDVERLAVHIAERSEGNPMFVGEILQSLEDEQILRPTSEGWALGDLDQQRVPPLLRQTLDARLAGLHRRTRAALQAAAVIGPEVSLDLWQAVSELDDQALDDVLRTALETRLLEETAGAIALQFRHALVREALYESLLLSRRRVFQRRVGEELAKSANPDPDAVAHHFRQAGDPRELKWLLRAGLRARRSAAWITAVERFERAAALLEDDPSRTRERAWLLFYAVYLSRYADNPRVADLLDEADRLAAEAGDQALYGSIRFHRGIQLGVRGEIRRGIQELRTAVDALENLDGSSSDAPADRMATAIIQNIIDERDQDVLSDDESRRHMPKFAHAVLANWLASTGHYQEALAIGTAAIEKMTDLVADDHLRTIPGAAVHLGIGQTYAALGRPSEARYEHDLARTGYEFAGDYGMASLCITSNLVLVEMSYGPDRLAERSRIVADARAVWEKADDLYGGGYTHSSASLIVSLIEGRWTDARRQCLTLIAAFPVFLVQIGLSCLGILGRHQGQSALAWEQVDRLLPDGADTEPGDSLFPYAHVAQRLAAELALDTGDLDLAREWIDAHGHWQEWSGAVLWRGDHLLLEARYYQVAGDVDQAREYGEAALAVASDPRQPLILIVADRLLGELAIRGQRFAEAEECLEESLALAEVCAAPFERAQTLLVLAELYTKTGKPDEAWKLLNEVRAIGTPLEATPTLRRATDIGAKLSVRRGQAVHPAGLTPREVEVLQHVAQGMTNAEVGDALYISARTVAQHLRSVYNKLGVDSRVEATRFAVEQGLVDSSSA